MQREGGGCGGVTVMQRQTKWMQRKWEYSSTGKEQNYLSFSLHSTDKGNMQSLTVEESNNTHGK